MARVAGGIGSIAVAGGMGSKAEGAFAAGSADAGDGIYELLWRGRRWWWVVSTGRRRHDDISGDIFCFGKCIGKRYIAQSYRVVDRGLVRGGG